ncbi:hypothetical protein I2485_07015 [Nesterenkonia sp. E16_7]|uniref:GNAT family N-acetyltransferase n=1 Tax=unclassified Nesterenkonia TaxID=2629769 RepID=UPI001A92A8B1|nr:MULTISPECIES: GNAT family N-acetyltransferase [unclassified Nesterenkonia]MBO0596961.1 hypothetical protein [Nesterenkonia sp. E16_10]MBO0598401.1 hypothetical protein [Nesterenkonia sp. E16_7]
MIEIREVEQGDDQWSAFGTDHIGFREHWWEELPDGEQGFRFLHDGDEIARVRLTAGRKDLDCFPALKGLKRIAEIYFIEVHAEHQGNGFGREVVSLLLALYPEHKFVAFSHRDVFWNEIGWQVCQGPETGSPLFAHLATES